MVHPYEGRLDAVERNIDPTTGTLAMQIKFRTPRASCGPGSTAG